MFGLTFSLSCLCSLMPAAECIEVPKIPKEPPLYSEIQSHCDQMLCCEGPWRMDALVCGVGHCYYKGVKKILPFVIGPVCPLLIIIISSLPINQVKGCKGVMNEASVIRDCHHSASLTSVKKLDPVYLQTNVYKNRHSYTQGKFIDAVSPSKCNKV